MSISAESDSDRRTRGLARGAVALVWLYNGLWCKLLARCPSHAAIAASLPEELGGAGRILLLAIGVTEVVIAGWVLSRQRPRESAAAQTALLFGMNAAGILFAPETVTEPAGLIVQNLAFLALVWLVALSDDKSPD